MEQKIKNNNHYFQFGRDIFWVALSNLIIALFGIITIPALTKTYSVELYGVWSQVLVTSSLLSPILTLHLGTAAVRFLAGENQKKILSQALSNMLLIIIMFIFIVITITYIIRFPLSNFLFDSSSYVVYVPLTFLWASTGALFTFMVSFLRSGGEIKRLSIIRFLSTLFKVIMLVALAKLNYSLIDIISSQIIADLVFIVSIYVYLTRKIGFSLPNLNIRGYLAYSIPDMPNGILLWILNLSDRYFITFYLGISQVGIYSVSYVFGSFLTIFYTPISFVLFPFLTRFWKNNDLKNVSLYLEYSLKYFLLLVIPSSGGLLLISNSLLKVLATSQYAVGGLLTFLVATGTIFLGIYQINIYIIYLKKENRYIPLITGLSALSNIALNIILIPKIGILGAALSTLIAYAILALIVTIWTKKSLKYHFDFKSLAKIIMATTIMLISLSFIKVSGALQIILFIISGAVIYFVLIYLFKTFSETEKRMIFQFIRSIKS